MSAIYFLTVRNLKRFFLDKAAVFFSFLTPMILLFLYVFFLGDLQREGIDGIIESVGLIADEKKSKLIVDRWLFANLLSVSVMTVPLGAAAVIVEDKEKKTIDDFISSPVENYKITLGYFLALLFINIVMNLGVIGIFEIYYLLSGGQVMSLNKIAEFILVMFIGLVMSTFMVTFIVSFFKSQNAYSGLVAFISAAFGFLIGAYVPMSMFPDWLQVISDILPNSHLSSLLRSAVMSDAIESFANPAAERALNDYFSVALKMGDKDIEKWISYLYCSLSGIVFFILSAIRYGRKSK